MADKKNAGGIFDRLFFKQEDPSGATGTQPTNPVTAGQGSNVLPPSSDPGADAFVGRFRDAIKSTDEIGAKFIEILYNLSPNPKEIDYQKALDVLRVINRTLTVSDIVSSMQRLIDMVRDEASRYIKEGNNKKASLQSAFEEEGRALNEKIATVTSEINALEESLRQKKAARDASEKELQGLSNKHQPKIDKVQITIANVQTASDKTRSSLEQTLNEINNYLK